jgi:hypothetical protein
MAMDHESLRLFDRWERARAAFQGTAEQFRQAMTFASEVRESIQQTREA